MGRLAVHGDAKHGWLARDEVRSPAPRPAPPIVAPKSYNRRWPRSAVICSRCGRRRLCCRRYSFRLTPAAFAVAAHRDYRRCALHSPTSFNRCARRRLHRPPLLTGSTLAASTVLCPAFAVAVLRVASAALAGGSAAVAALSVRIAMPTRATWIARDGSLPSPLSSHALREHAHRWRP